MLPIDEGFNTTGNIAVSPYFRGFRLVGDDMLTFHCTFSICDGYCDGVSTLWHSFSIERATKYRLNRLAADLWQKVDKRKSSRIFQSSF